MDSLITQRRLTLHVPRQRVAPRPQLLDPAPPCPQSSDLGGSKCMSAAPPCTSSSTCTLMEAFPLFTLRGRYTALGWSSVSLSPLPTSLHLHHSREVSLSYRRLGFDPPAVTPPRANQITNPSGAFGSPPPAHQPGSSSPISSLASPPFAGLVGEQAFNSPAWALQNPTSPEGQILAKYKRAKKLLQVRNLLSKACLVTLFHNIR